MSAHCNDSGSTSRHLVFSCRQLTHYGCRKARTTNLGLHFTQLAGTLRLQPAGKRRFRNAAITASQLHALSQNSFLASKTAYESDQIQTERQHDERSCADDVSINGVVPCRSIIHSCEILQLHQHPHKRQRRRKPAGPYKRRHRFRTRRDRRRKGQDNSDRTRKKLGRYQGKTRPPIKSAHGNPLLNQLLYQLIPLCEVRRSPRMSRPVACGNGSSADSIAVTLESGKRKDPPC